MQFKPYNIKRPTSPWNKPAADAACNLDDQLVQRIEEAMAYAFGQGFIAGMRSGPPREDMGR
jgi:hypothetical protein